MKIEELVERYTYRVEWSEEDGTHIAKCAELPSLAAHGEKATEAIGELEKVVMETLKWMEEEGEDIPVALSTRKYKGNLTLRVPSDVHRKLAIESSEQGVSINQLILSRL
ncbi:MAG: toxin-antitoxin system HicB family antitoxin [Spirochaetales bacterium]|nr:toxin-antitoxin system HicB family antitoxin [Spirochaetales bacterium]